MNKGPVGRFVVVRRKERVMAVVHCLNQEVRTEIKPHKRQKI